MLPPTTKPYMIRALYEWCLDQDYTPHILVEVNSQCRVPMQYVSDGTIILNIGPAATKHLTIDNDWIQFTARFSGVSQMVAVPVARVGALYTRETQEGMGFDVSELEGTDASEFDSELERRQDEWSEEGEGGNVSSSSAGSVTGSASTQATTQASSSSSRSSSSERDEDKAKQEARARFKLVED